MANPTQILEILEFYIYLNVDQYFIKKLCYRIGKKLECLESIFNVREYVLESIVKYYPSLFYGKKYCFEFLSQKTRDDLILNKYKNISFYYHDENKLEFSIEDYIKFNNFAIAKYYHKNIRKMTQENLEQAAQHNFLELIEYVHEMGQDLTGNDFGVAEIACEYGHLEMMEFLYENNSMSLNSLMISFFEGKPNIHKFMASNRPKLIGEFNETKILEKFEAGEGSTPAKCITMLSSILSFAKIVIPSIGDELDEKFADFYKHFDSILIPEHK